MKKLFTLLALAFCLNGWAQCPVIGTPTVGLDYYVYCQGAIISPIIATPVANSVPVWYVGTSFVDTGSTFIPTSIIGTTVYNVYDSAWSGCKSTALTVTVMVLSTPTPPVLSGGVTNPLVECQGVTPSTFSVTASAGIIPVWYVGGTYITAGSTYSPSTSLNGTTVYTVYDSSGVSGCTSLGAGNVLTLTVTVNPAPTMIATGATVCPSDIVPAPSIVTNPAAGVTFSWSVTNNVNIGMPASGTGMPVAYPAPRNISLTNQIGVITYTPVLVGCAGLPTTDTICIKPTPFMQPIANQTVCSNSMTNPVTFGTIPSSAGAMYISYNWNYNVGGIATIGTGSPFPSVGPVANSGSTPIATIINVSPTLNGCQGPDSSFIIVVNPTPIAGFTLTPDAAPHTWDAYPTYAADVASATWYWGDGTSTTTLYPSHTYSAAGTYSICVVATNSTGCVADFCQSDSVFRLANNSTYSNMVYVNVKQGAAGIAQVAGINEEVSIYPNPATTSLQVSFSGNSANSTLVITDMLGNTVKQLSVTTQLTTISVADLNEGVYNISTSSRAGIVNKRVVIVR